MQRNKSKLFLTRLWNLFFKPSRDNNGEMSLVGSQRPLRFTSQRIGSKLLEIPDTPIRPIAGNLTNAIELLEMLTWCREAKDSLRIMSKDSFQNIEGSTDSWTVVCRNPEAQAIVDELQRRRSNKVPVIGGSRLINAVYSMLGQGDSFLELGFDKDESGKWCISKSNYLPPLSVFIDQTDIGETVDYRQQTSYLPREDDRVIHPVKILHFQYDKSGIYGTGLLLPSLEPWRKVKEVSIDIEEASRAAGLAPWVHTMPEGASEDYRQNYRADIDDQRRDGVITDLYLMPGGDVRKAANDTDLAPLIDYWLQLRYQCIPSTFPIWMFPGMGLESAAGKEIANQPALAYARTIAHIRTIVSEQIEFAVAVELVLQRGWDWYTANGEFEVQWAEWFVTGMEQGVLHQDQQES